MGEIRIGISGWRYPPWRGEFYPKGLPQRDELRYAASRLNSIEINGSFYSLQRPQSYRSWYEQTPDGFVFAVKGSRFITHMMRLRDSGTVLPNFFASGLLALREKLGPVLWQFPPTLQFDAEVLDAFLSRLPRTTAEAAYLARRHDDRLTDRAWTGVDADRPLRHAIEVRHPSFEAQRFTEVLREHGVAAVLADAGGRWPTIREATADFGYLRLHGADELYASGYDDAALTEWAAVITELAPRDVYVYFDNDAKVRAPFDAMALAAKLGVTVG
ncbi:MAG TPA: DUF72 domain-containing protein [Jatrophihabitantaceae bacterium]